jgi:hypothetical protein
MSTILNIGNKILFNSYPYFPIVYGVEWDINNGTTLLTRTGNLDLHHADTGLPIQNKMRRCLLLDNGTVNYYLDPTDSTKKENGDPSVLDGTDGQVMVEIPQHYRKFEYVGDIQRVLISEFPFQGAKLIPLSYISAYEATVFRPENKLSSVINTSADYRGGNNNSALDAELSSLLGMPATNISRVNFTAFAENRGAKWFAQLYEVYKTVFYLYLIEHANRNSQAAFNATLTTEGYRQGGLGDGVTDINSTDWLNFNNRYPIVPCGSGTLDNFTSSTAFTHPVLGGTNIPQYRGIEHPFGHIWKWTEGVNIRSIADGNIELYTADGYTFSSTNYTGYTLQGNLALTNSWVRNLLVGEQSNEIELLPSVVGSGAGSTTFWSDFYNQSRPSSGESLRGLLLGGNAFAGSTAGLVLSFVNFVPSAANSSVGSRLCFVPSA